MRINFWSGPRNLSTAIMYSFAQRSDTQVVDEPLYAHYLDQTKKDHPGKNEILLSQNTDAGKVIQEVILGEYEKPIVFFKQMAHHAAHLDLAFTKSCKNIVLLRNPQEMILSILKIIDKPAIKDLGLHDLFTVQQYLINNDCLNAIFDSGDLLKDPRQMLTKLCTSLEIPFEERMLSWKAGPIQEDGCWAKYWYKNVHTTTGFEKITHADRKKIPAEYNELYKECLHFYDIMNANSLKTE